jgi:adenosylmethionine-8-amino-7-oxononanoate transaminase/dethiobiotin synthase
MHDLLILGTDTDAGKTTFALLWMSAFGDRYEYWKPVETGPSDSDTIHKLVPEATVHAPYQRFEAPLAPPLAASKQGAEVANAGWIARARPALSNQDRRLLIETFGSPYSPLNQTQLQLELVRLLDAARVLVVSSALGAVGRGLQCLQSLDRQSLAPSAVVLVGPIDNYAATEIARHSGLEVFSLQPPPAYDVGTIRRATAQQRERLVALELVVGFSLARSMAGAKSAADAPEWIAQDHATVWHPYTSLREADPPLPCRSARDEFLYLYDGRRLIDAISSWWTILHGHRHPTLMRCLAATADGIDHVHFAGVTHPWAVELARWLLKPFPWDGGRVFYSDNGSTAVEVGLKMAYQLWCHHGEPQRTRFVGFEHGYHGDTFGAMAVSRDPVFFGRFEPLLFQADILPVDPNRLNEHLSKHRGQVAGVIIEPLVQGAGGMRMHSAETLRAIATVAREHETLFIADEVMTGCGRTGTLWAHQAAGVVPDLVCTAKTLAGGVLPLAATLVAPRVVAAFETADRGRTFFHGHSFTAHPLACAVACANMELLKRRGTLEKPRAMEQFWRHALDPLRREPNVKDVRIRGSIAAVELDVPGGYLADVGRTMRQKALEMGVLLRPLGSVLYAMPPFCTSKASLERIAEAMHAAVKAVSL